MNSQKLLEAIAELEAQRRIIDDAIIHMQRAYASLNGTGEGPLSNLPIADRVIRRRYSDRPSYVDEAVAAIQAAGHSLHISAILDHIKASRGEAASRTSVESSILREIKLARKINRTSRVSKTGRSTFDIPLSFAIAS
jgi:hypothetical protein